MQITIIAFGTRGDVQPTIALGQALVATGHRVRLLASAHFKPWIESHGLQAALSTVDVQAVMESEGGRDWVENGNNPFKQLRVMRQLLNKHGLRMAQEAWEACRDAEAILSQFTSMTYAVSIAEKLRCPHVCMMLQPALVATRAGAAMLNAPLPNRRSLINYWFGKLIIQPAGWTLYGDITNHFRQTVLGLPPQTRQQNIAALLATPFIHGYSPRVVPQPADWPAQYHTTGYWFLDEGDQWTPPADLRRFLEAGPPPIGIGFGSMTGHDNAAVTRLLIEAVHLSGQRAILLSGWAGLGEAELPDTILRLEAAPHDWLFPRLAAVVHHGGAGTTAASLRAGVPTIIVPHMADQPFWGRRVHALGVGPPAIPRPHLTASKLAAAIRAATSDALMKQRATALGTAIGAEDGTRTALAWLEHYLRQPDVG